MANANRDLAISMPESWEVFEKYKAALAGVNEESEKFTQNAEGIQRVAGELNQVMPGLGEGFHGLEQAIRGAGGGLDVLALAIQAAQTYWDLYTEAAKRAAEAQAEAWKQADEASRKARESMENYLTALAKARSSDDDYRAGLQEDIELTNAEAEARKKVLKAMEDTEMAHATTAEEKKAIQQKYADIEQDLDKSTAEQKIKDYQDAIARINDSEKKALKKKEDLEIQRDAAASEFGAADTRTHAWDKQINDLQNQIVEMEKEKTKLQNDIGTQQNVNAVIAQGDVDAGIARGDVAAAAKGIADIVKSGGVVTEDKKAFMTEIADDIAHQIGAIKPNQNFASGQAAATFLENWLKSQTDPYNALFARIHSAMVATQQGQNQLGVFWEQKFKELEDKVHGHALNFKQ